MHTPPNADQPTSFDYPGGWSAAIGETPGPFVHNGMIVCAICPDHAAQPDGWRGKPLPPFRVPPHPGGVSTTKTVAEEQSRRPPRT
jgi:hypothetical protein